MARRHVDDAAHVNEFHGDAHTVIQARTIRELHVYGVSVYLTPLPGWAAARRAASAVALFAVGFFLLATGLMAEKRGAAGWLLAVAGLAVLTAAGAWGQLVWKRWQLSRGRYENLLQARLDALTASLTRAQRLQWRSEVIARGVQDAKLMPVRYRSAGDDLQGHRPGTQLGAGPAQPRLDGEAGDIAELYDTLRARRLVVLGKPGAGKSVTALRFALDKVEHRQPGDRLPVILSIGSWDPAEHGLWQWAAGRLAIENPQLAKPTGFGTTLAEELAAPERLLLILDGFDELPAGWRPQALRVLNDSLDERTHLVLMGRTRAYRDAALQSGVLAASVAVQLEPLTGNELIGHLDAASHRTRVDGSPLWEPVAARVRDAGSDPLGARLLAALSTPLMAALALTAYTAAPADPAELLDAGAFPTAASIESHLIDQLIPAVYDLPPGVGIRPRWRAEKARRWLRWLAADTAAYGSDGDLAWWRWAGGTSRAAAASIVVLVYLGTVILTSSLPIRGNMRWLGVAMPPWLAMAISGLIPLAIAIVDVYVTTPLPTCLQPRGRLAAILTRGAVGLAVVGLAWLTDARAAPNSEGFPLAVAVPLAALFAVRGVPGIGVRLVQSSPRALLRSDRSASLALAVVLTVAGPRRWCMEAFVLTPIVLLATWDEHAGAGEGAQPWIALMVAILALTFTYGLTAGAWGRFAAGRVLLASTGKLPWRTLGFMKDAHQRGVLHQSGGTYRFRHARLQEQLLGDAPSAAARRYKAFVAGLERRPPWPAPAVVAVVLLWAVMFAGLATLQSSIGVIRRAAGPFFPVRSDCSLITNGTLATVLRGTPARDQAGGDLGGLFFDGPWCSWHARDEGSWLGIASDVAGPTQDMSATQEARREFAWLGQNMSTRHATASDGLCDWYHEVQSIDVGRGVSLVTDQPVIGGFDTSFLRCQNVIFEISYTYVGNEVSAAQVTAATQQLLRTAVRSARGSS